MEPILLLVHRLPYPPNKGDKIRSYNLLKYLSARYEVHLATFIDDPYDWRYADKVKSLCKSTFIRPQNKKISTLKSLLGLITGKALSLSFYADNKVKKWCENIIQTENIKTTIVFSSPMAQFVNRGFSDLNRVIDFVDIDSDKWLQYSKSKSWPLSWIYKREAKKLGQYECYIAGQFQKSFFVSDAESDMFKKLCPDAAEKITSYDNGVDFNHFSFNEMLKNPFPSDKIITFAGAMDYWANVDAVIWFSNKVFPLIKKEINDVQFYIVGSKPSEAVKELEKHSGITVTGRIADIRQYVQYANVSVAPMRIARGVQNKVIEALSLERPVVATSLAAEGLKSGVSDEILYIADTEEEFARLCISILTSSMPCINKAGRDYILGNYNWDKNLLVVEEAL